MKVGTVLPSSLAITTAWHSEIPERNIFPKKKSANSSELKINLPFSAFQEFCKPQKIG
ncbi:hypothetical protein [Biformimicrobium ophioploci]|uniref:hypothetical protein n=1 Tax=Biformimicrobium ophioploci TaxID=3036711 RepID=UPI00255236C1|nr:hypothetical protein [Microbulbifer sp. NKW57]